jgi:signal transduction histidine kinase
MKNQITAKSRKELKNKMAAAISKEIRTLSRDLQNVLLDDLVTALENRLAILNRTRQNLQCTVAIRECAEFETIET